MIVFLFFFIVLGVFGKRGKYAKNHKPSPTELNLDGIMSKCDLLAKVEPPPKGRVSDGY